MTRQAESYAIAHASLRARLLCTTAGFSWNEMDDARQDLLLDYLRRLPKFDGGRGDRDAFVRGVMRNHATVLAKRRHRIARREVLADDLPRTDERSESDLSEILDGLHQHEIEPALQISIDVKRVLDGLPDRLHRLARLLSELSVLEACLAIGKSRSTVYQMMRQIRAAFIHAGLEPRGVSSTEAASECQRR
jgi:RNA polymerase sigma factor (sigma-70 family)